MIEINHLVKCFGDCRAVDDLSFTVEAGEVLGFLGPNGAGKSTCMKMISGFLSPDSGSVKVFGLSTADDAIAVKKLLGYLPEGAPSYGDMTVLSFVNFIAEIRGLKGSRKARQVQKVLEQLQLVSVSQQVIDTLSKGFKRRVGLAQAIVHDPKVLILDEPTDGLDPNQKQQVRELIRNLSREKIVIISTHILEEVSAVCSRAIIVHKGQLVADGTPGELRKRSRYCGAITLTLTSTEVNPEAVLSTLKAIDGVARVERCDELDNSYTLFPQGESDIYNAVNKAVAAQKNWSLIELQLEQGRLDDIFCTLTGEQNA